MPRLHHNVLSSVFFLYPTVGDAKAGRNAEGTGFLVSWPAWVNGEHVGNHYYAVTNRHIVDPKGSNSPVIRLNAKSGVPDFIRLTTDDWHYFDAGDDVAVADIALDWDLHDVALIDEFLFANHQWMEEHSVGVGDDVFMMGLFIDNEVQTHNVPKARFGHISMMAHQAAPVRQPHGTNNSSIIVDMHSRSGFSGSPVFVYRTVGADLTQLSFADFKVNQPTLFKFLGIHWGQFPETYKIRRNDKVREMKLEGMSGMSCVIPAWRIHDMIDTHPTLVSERRAKEVEFAKNPRARWQAVPMNEGRDSGKAG